MTTQIGQDSALQAFKDALETMNNAFHAPKNKKHLKDLKGSFWAALADLHFVVCVLAPTREEIIAQFRSAYKQLGAPGDFGYGTPCGDSLAAVYDRYNDFLASKSS